MFKYKVCKEGNFFLKSKYVPDLLTNNVRRGVNIPLKRAAVAPNPTN